MPYIQQFKEFKEKIWGTFDLENFEKLNVDESAKERADHIIAFCKEQLSSNEKIRGDYKECLELVLVCLGETPEEFSFKLPGAVSKTRWMAVLIYGLKIFLFRFELKKTAEEIAKLERFATFGCLYYIQHWFHAPIAVNAPKADLDLYHDMFRYKKIDSKVANAVLDKLKLHTWYLNQEYTPLSLFSNLVSNEEKSEIAQKICETPPSEQYAGMECM